MKGQEERKIGRIAIPILIAASLLAVCFFLFFAN